MTTVKQLILLSNDAYRDSRYDDCFQLAREVFNAFNVYPSPVIDYPNPSVLGEMYLNLATLSQDWSYLQKVSMENGFYCMLKAMKKKSRDSQRAAMLLFLFICDKFPLVMQLCGYTYNIMIDLVMGQPVHPFLRPQLMATEQLQNQLANRLKMYCLSVFDKKNEHVILSIEIMDKLENAVRDFKSFLGPNTIYTKHRFTEEILWKFLSDEVQNNRMNQYRMMEY